MQILLIKHSTHGHCIRDFSTLCEYLSIRWQRSVWPEYEIHPLQRSIFMFGVHFMFYNNIVHEWFKDRTFSKSKFANHFNKTGCARAIFSHFLKMRIWHVYALSAAFFAALSSHGASIARIILLACHFFHLVASILVLCQGGPR